MAILIEMRDVLKDMKWHKRLGKKLAIVGDIGKIRSSIVKVPLLAEHKDDADHLFEVLGELETAVDDDDYLDARKKLEAAITAAARLVADGEIDEWRKSS